MNLLQLSWRNLAAKPLSTFLSLMLLTLGVSIISLLLLLNKQLSENFEKNVKGIDMVVGAKGSPLQLILASVYHIDAPTGNIPLEEANSLKQHPLIKQAIPLAYGDNYQGYRILGTDTAYVGHYEATLANGVLWSKKLEVSIGSTVAKNLGLKVGDTFHGAHGLTGNFDVHDELSYTVVGVFTASGTVIDQLILTGLESVWSIHDHEEDDDSHEEEDTHEEDEAHHDHENEANDAEAHEDEQEITALLVTFRSPMGTVALPRMINENTSMQAALPAIEINRLFSLMGVGIDTLRALALAIIIISGISVFISLYSSLKARKYELALMRTLGASQSSLFFLIILEGILLAIGGFLLGFLVSRVGMWGLSNLVESSYHYEFSAYYPLAAESVLFLGTLGIGLIAASIPAIQAYNTQISQTLVEG